MGIIITSFIGVMLILSAYSNHISPNVIHYAVYLSLAFHVLVWLNIAILIFWAVQKSKIAFISIVAIALTWSATYRYCPINFKNSEYNGGEKVTVMSYNTCSLNKMHQHTKDNPNPIIEYIKEVDADIVCLQEYAIGKSKNSIKERDIERTLKEQYPYKKIFLSNNSYYESGLACMSKYPIVEATPIIYPKKTNGSIMYSIDVKGRIIKVVVNHLESNRFSSDDRGLFNYVTTHLSESDSLMGDVKRQIVWKLANASKRRAKQADVIANYIKDIDDYIIVCGDFNDTQQSYVYDKIRGNLKDAYVENCFGPDITYHADKFLFRIDHILYGNGLNPLNTKIDKSIKVSDHYPVITTFEIR